MIAGGAPYETAIARDYLNNAAAVSISLRVSLLLGIVDHMAARGRARLSVLSPRIVKEPLHRLVWVVRWTAGRRLSHIIIHF